MSTRLLSFLNDIERALQAANAAMDGEAWETSRSVNYHSGLARLTLSARTDSHVLQPLGSVLLQAFHLADGSLCLKTFMNWTGSSSEVIHAIYAKPGINWEVEGQRVAEFWLDGRSRALEAGMAEDRIAAAG
jgi:hypothetical protein